MSRHAFVTWIMDLQLQRGTKPFCLSAEFWARAALLAAARVISNDGVRAVRADRGEDNGKVDLMGAASELCLLALLRSYRDKLIARPQCEKTTALLEQTAAGIDYLSKGLYVDGGGAHAAGADLVFGLDVPGESIDAKSFNMSPRNKYFAINNNKHLQLTRVRPDYFCMISLPLGNGVQFCIVPHADVDGWDVKEQRRCKQPPPITDIKAFTESRLGTEYSVLTSRLSKCFAREQVKHDALENAEVLARLHQDSPNLCRAVPILTSELRTSVTALLEK